MKSALYIVLGTILGWSLGLLSPWLADVIQRPYRRSQIKRSIFIELRELRAKVVSVVIRAGITRGTLDAATLRWARAIVEEDKESFRRLGDIEWDKVSQYSDDDLKRLSRATTPKGEALKFRHYSLPYLEAHLNVLNLFPDEFQRLVHRVRGSLSNLNQEADLGLFYFQATFDNSMSRGNRDIIGEGLAGTHDFMGRVSRQVAEDITRILEL
jgi:hypothetical protein